MAASLTLVPAFCGFAGRRLLPRRVRRLPRRAPDDASRRDGPLGTAALGRRPLALPAVGRCAADAHCSPCRTRARHADLAAGRSQHSPHDLTTRRAYDLVRPSSAPAPTARSRWSWTGRRLATARSRGSTVRTLPAQPGHRRRRPRRPPAGRRHDGARGRADAPARPTPQTPGLRRRPARTTSCPTAPSSPARRRSSPTSPGMLADRLWLVVGVRGRPSRCSCWRWCSARWWCRSRPPR